jgi:hypothetical protein
VVVGRHGDFGAALQQRCRRGCTVGRVAVPKDERARGEGDAEDRRAEPHDATHTRQITGLEMWKEYY